MTPARFQTIEEIFLAAVEQSPGQVSAFLDTACEGDAVLQREVEALLASDQRAGRFIETSSVGLATKVIQNQQADSLIGQTIGHYKISESIGIGGMGEVYLATDITAGRKAALKLLPLRFTGDAERLKRFQQEAHAVVGLNHPNILTVYEIGEDHSIHYIASELIEGETLREHLTRGRMELIEAVDVAIQMASALAAAHNAGIVHRDIKPENIMLRPDGYVKVLDFGIAKLAEQEMPVNMPRDEALLVVETNLGSILGTVRYMSPEQACGGQLDETTDIWSLGVVLYEMATAHSPFAGGTPREVMSSILETEPPPLTRYNKQTPAELQQIISKTLCKDRKERYRSAHDLFKALKDLRHKLQFEVELERATAPPAWLHWTRSPAALVLVLLVAALALALPFYWHQNLTTSSPPEKSIAVLPFENRSRDPDNAYFADSIQDEVLTRLSKIADLKVISRTSTQHYKSAPENLPEIAKQLGVSHILEGSVQKSGDAVRVNVQLIKATTDSHIWADTFDRKLTEIFSVETEVAEAIADQLRAKLTGEEERVIAAKPTDNVEAYDAYLRGLAYTLKRGSTADALGAQKYLREAVRLDPKFALSWALLAYVDALGYLAATLQPTVALREEARQAAETALTLQPNLGEALLAKGHYHYACLKDYDTAVRYFEQARQLLPNSSRIPESLAYVARRRGQWERSESYLNETERLDPRNVSLLTQHAGFYIILRRFPEALRKLEQVLDITPDDVDILALKASVAQAEGDLPRAAALLAPLRPAADHNQTLETQVYQGILERRPAPIIPRLKEILAKPDPALGYINGELRFWLGWAQEVADDHAAARETWRQARSELESFLREQPENHFLIGDLALANMGLGDKRAALALAERAMAELPTEKDAVFGLIPLEILARVAAQMGELNRAIAALEKLLSTPYAGALPSGPLTPALLRLDPMFDPLRNDPRFQELVAKTGPLPEKSIAVLPFQNLSKDEENAFFAGGVQDEILTDLAKIADLKVISPTSVMEYKSGPERNLREIAKALGVSHVVEGSVQRAGERVRVSAQLIDARNDTHLWAEHYDRDVADVFAVQSEIAQQIADQLKAKLSPAEKAAIAERPTTDLVAYAYYTKAREISIYGNWEGAENEKAAKQKVELLEKATQRDPNFALAYCALAKAQLDVANFELAKKAAETALRLRPDLAEPHVALARYCWLAPDSIIGEDSDREAYYDRARDELAIVRRMSPNNAEALLIDATIGRHQNRWDASLANLQRANELDPQNGEVAFRLAQIYFEMRRYSELEEFIRKGAARRGPLGPLEDPFNWLARTKLAQGNPVAAQSLLEQLPPEYSPGWGTLDVRFKTALYLGDYDAVNRVIAATPAGEALETFGRPPGWADGLVARARGDKQKAQAAFAAAREKMEATRGDKPKDVQYFADIAILDAGLGRKEEAIREAQRAVELMPITKDSLNGPSMVANLALVYAWTGERDRALEQLAKVATLPAELHYAATYGDLRFNPCWDDLRGDPRFDKIVAAAKAASR